VLIKKTTTLFSLITSLLTTYEAYKEDIIKTVQEYCLPTIKISLSRIKAIYKNWGENNLIKHEESWQQLIIDDSEKLLYNYSLCKRELGTDAFGLDEEITRVEESFNMFLRLQEKMQEKSTAKKLEHLGNVD
jgi:hypothetical protein